MTVGLFPGEGFSFAFDGLLGGRLLRRLGTSREATRDSHIHLLHLLPEG